MKVAKIILPLVLGLAGGLVAVFMADSLKQGKTNLFYSMQLSDRELPEM